MGRILQRTAISTNIKERLDFSCALFGPDGGLVSNAPHIPVHLGAMQSTVRYQMDQLGNGQLHKGDVILANHPQGSTYTIENMAFLYCFTLFVLPKGIEIIHRLFLVIAMYCQASSINHSTSHATSWLGIIHKECSRKQLTRNNLYTISTSLVFQCIPQR
jgi:hypothetical protein